VSVSHKRWCRCKAFGAYCYAWYNKHELFQDIYNWLPLLLSNDLLITVNIYCTGSECQMAPKKVIKLNKQPSWKLGPPSLTLMAFFYKDKYFSSRLRTPLLVCLSFAHCSTSVTKEYTFNKLSCQLSVMNDCRLCSSILLGLMESRISWVRPQRVYDLAVNLMPPMSPVLMLRLLHYLAAFLYLCSCLCR